MFETRVNKKFTMLELLIVITIIVILASLLLPSLQKAKQRGQDLACRGNLKQMGLAAAVYTSDYNDWTVCAMPGGNNANGMWAKMFNDFGYINTKSTFKCPAEPVFEFTLSRVNYGLNFYTFGAWTTHTYAKPKKAQDISRFGRDSSLVYFVDTPPTSYSTVGIGFSSDSAAVAIGVGVYPISSAWYPCYARHNLKMNAAIFDGHVESLSGTGPSVARCRSYWNPTQYCSGTATLQIYAF